MTTALMVACTSTDNPLDPGDTTAPTVLSTAPANNAVGVAGDTPVSFTFSEAMAPGTADSQSVVMTGGAITTMSWPNSHTLVLDHAAWNDSSTVSVTLGTALTDVAGNHLAAPVNISFETLTQDLTAPTVTAISPADGADNVAPNAAVTIIFSEAMNPAGADSAVTMTGGAITGLDWVTADTLRVQHEDWTEKSMVGVTVGTSLADLAGNHLAAPFSAQFSVTVPDTTAPNVNSVLPAVAALNVALDADLTIFFNEPMDPTSVTGHIIMNHGAVTGLSWTDDRTVVVHHDPWPEQTQIIATVQSAVQDLAGNPMGHDVGWLFTTLDATPPSVLNVTPNDGSVDVAVDADVTIVFSEELDPITLDGNIELSGGYPTLEWTDDVTLVLHHQLWESGWPIDLTVGTGIADLAGNHPDQPTTIHFTVAGTDTTAPTIVFAEPAGGVTDINPMAEVRVHFSEPMDSATLGQTGPDPAITNTPHWEQGNILVFNHDLAAWPAGSSVTVTVDGTLTDLAGNSLANPGQFSFSVMADTTPPDVASITPADGTTEVARDEDVVVTFTEPVDQSCAASHLQLSNNGITTLEWLNGETVILHHEPWDLGAQVSVMVQSGVCDLNGVVMQHDVTATFQVVNDGTPPQIVSIDPASGSTITTDVSTMTITFSEPILADSFRISAINGQLFNQIPENGLSFAPDGRSLTVALRTPLPEGVPLATDISAYADEAGNWNTQPTTWQVQVAGTADYYPVNDALVYEFSGMNVDNGSPTWDGNWWSSYHRFQWETAVDFRRLELDSPGATATDWNYMTKNADAIVFRGFREHDEQGGTDDDFMFDPAVEYMPLPLVGGYNWSGTSTISTGDGDVNLSYTGEVFSGTSELELPSSLLENDGPISTGTRVYWNDCRTMRLYHDMVTATGDTMNVGVDTLQVVPGIGIVRESSRDEDFQDDSWSWNNEFLFNTEELVK